MMNVVVYTFRSNQSLRISSLCYHIFTYYQIRYINGRWNSLGYKGYFFGFVCGLYCSLILPFFMLNTLVMGLQYALLLVFFRFGRAVLVFLVSYFAIRLFDGFLRK